MSRRFLFSRGAVHARMASILVAAAAMFTGSFALAQGAAEAQVDAHLAAGEFGPARAIAAAAEPAARDRLLAQVAAAQADAGARRASLATIGDIAGDQARTDSLTGMLGRPLGGAGGAAEADFESLIELITSTVSPPTWDEVGGPGAIREFPGGVYVDPAGILRKITVDGTPRLASVRSEASAIGGNRDVRLPSTFRKVSLNRLEKEAQLLWAQGRNPDEAMRNLAGIYEVKYLLVYPESGDIVIAGPGGDWKVNDEGRTVNIETGRPVLQLDDLVVLLRNSFGRDGTFTCSIVPTQENLAATKEFLAAQAKSPLKPGRAPREKWLGDLQKSLGRQKIEVTGINPETRVARVIVEADYHMKLVGMGLEEGTLGVESYLDSIKLAKGEAPPPMNVLRWWFTLNYDAIKATKPHDAFELAGQGVKVLSENEMLTERGERVHTGESDALTSRFATSFTEHFGTLTEKYPVYAELQNIFDLALLSALMKSEDLPSQVGWHLTHFGPEGAYQVELGAAPTEVDTVINHRIVNGNQILAGVSGGVAFRPQELVKADAIKTDSAKVLEADRQSGAPHGLVKGMWWWD